MIQFRPMGLEDAKIRVKWLAKPEVNHYMSSEVRNGTTLADEEKKFKNRASEKKTREIFIILDGEKPIGDVGLVDVDHVDKNAFLIVMIGEDGYRSKGIGSKALDFITKYGFEKLGLHKISLQVNEDNIPAIKCYQKFGFEEEGRLKEHAYIDSEFKDEIIMSFFNK
jgi:RimJ/RimL family protein N-acetyltransferase